MAPTLAEVLAVLDADEPQYPEAARHLGPDAVPHLAAIAREPDQMLASKAVYLASLFHDHPQAVDVLERAARSPEPALRVAAATAIRNLPGDATIPTLLNLLRDAEVGVRKTALAAVRSTQGEAVREVVRAMSQHDSSTQLRELSARVLDRLSKKNQ